MPPIYLEKSNIANVAGTIINPATEDAQTDGSHKTQVVDAAGNVMDSHVAADGGYHLGTSVIQNTIASTNNYSTDNLAVSATYTGTADETFGVNGIKIFHHADQDCTIYLDQSMSSTVWTEAITDEYTCLANNACSRTFSSASPYFRIRVTNTGTATTTKFVTAVGMTPISSVLPRSLSDDDRLKTETTITGYSHAGRHAFISPLDSLTVNSTVRLCGNAFNNGTKDPNFWAETVTNGGTVVQAGGEVKLSTNTTANGTAKYQSISKARFVVSRPLKFFGFFALETDAVANNIRRVGAYDANNGVFFEVNGTVFSIGTRKTAADTIISTGSFNGNYGPSWSPEAAETYYKLEIEYGAYGVNFYIDSVLLHSLGIYHYTDTWTLPVTLENINSGGSIVNSVMDCLGASIVGQGKAETSPIYKYISGAATTVCKYGAGDLHIINNNDNAGSYIIYDGLSAAGVVMASVDATKVLGSLTFRCPFSTGLTIVTTGAVKLTVVYE